MAKSFTLYPSETRRTILGKFDTLKLTGTAPFF